MSDNIKKQDKGLKKDQSGEHLKTENNKDKPEKEFGERRSGQDRRKFSYGYQGHERRNGFDRRKENTSSD